MMPRPERIRHRDPAQDGDGEDQDGHPFIAAHGTLHRDLRPQPADGPGHVRDFRLERVDQQCRHDGQAEQEHREGVDGPGDVVHQEAARFRIQRIVEEVLPVTDDDGVPGAAGRRRHTRDGAAIGNREQDDGRQIVDLLRVVRRERDQRDAHGQHHGGNRVLADEGGENAADRDDAEADPVDVGPGHPHDPPGNALVEPLLDDGHGKHQRAHDEEHGIGHQAAGHFRGVDAEQDHLAHDDEQWYGGQRNGLGDEQHGRHERHDQNDLAFVGQARGGWRRHQREAQDHGDEEPAPAPDKGEVHEGHEVQEALVAAAPDPPDAGRGLARLQAVAGQLKLRGGRAHGVTLAPRACAVRQCR